MNELPVSDDVKLKFELQQDKEVYKKNVEIGEKISLILHRGVILENSLSKQNKLCLDLFRAQTPTIDVESVELLLWQEQLLDIIKVDQMEDMGYWKTRKLRKILISGLYSKIVRKSSCCSF